MSRYMERADGVLRMLKINYASSQDDIQEFSWKPVLRIFSYLPEEEASMLSDNSRAVLQYMVTDRENLNSVLNSVTRARENARSAQDHITKEVWQCLNEFDHLIRDRQLTKGLNADDPVSVLDVLIRQGLLYYGIMDITMARGEGYAFINLGKYLERAVQSADILDIKYSDPQFDLSRTDTTYWKYLLLSISGYELYLKTFPGGFDSRNVLELVVLNEDFPRSMIHSVTRLHRYFGRLKSEANREAWQSVDFMIGSIRSRIKYSTAESILRQGLHAYLAGVKEELFRIGNALNQHYFAYT
jgi:uncharacterized alpha-E superfamily protein